MSITDELRTSGTHGYKYPSNTWTFTDEELTAIADRIDAEHERVRAESILDMTDERMAEHGWIRLPKDADGEYIHIGDVMEGVDKYDSLKKVKGKVITVSYEADGIVDVAIQAWNSDGKSWHRAYLDPNASIYRHYHAPTVEDVLRQVIACANNGQHVHGALATEDIIAEYAAKLKLAEGEDA